MLQETLFVFAYTELTNEERHGWLNKICNRMYGSVNYFPEYMGDFIDAYKHTFKSLPKDPRFLWILDYKRNDRA